MLEGRESLPSSRLYRHLSILRWLALAFGLVVVLHHQLIEGVIRQSASPNLELLIELAYGILLSLSGWLILTWLWRSVGQTEKAERALNQTHIKLWQTNQRLELVLQVNRRLSEAQDDTALVNTIGDLFKGVAPTVACTLIRFDAEQRMLPVAYCIDGDSIVFDDHMAHLSASEALQRCQACTERLPEERNTCSLVELPLPSSTIKKIHCLKLTRADQVYGIVGLYLRDVTYPNDQEQLLLNMMANEITLALESHALRSRELSMLNRLQEARRLSNLHDELAGALTDIVKALEVSGGLLFLVDRTTSELQLQAEAGQSLGDALSLVRNLARGAGQTETPLIIGDLVQSNDIEIHSLLITPLHIGKRILGSLVLWSVQPDAFNRRRSQLVSTVAGQAALLIENNQLYLRGEQRAVLAERARLAREIHDGLAQTLGYLKLRTAQINNRLDYGEDQQVKSGLDEVQQLLGEAYVNTREAIDGLHLNAQEYDVQAWVEEIVLEFETLSGIPVSLTPAPEISLLPEVHVQLQRIVQETFSNIRKHADATRAWLEWQQDDYSVILQIRDNGCGFDMNDIPPAERHGLRIMRERVELLDADFQVASQEDKGTRIIVRLPLKEPVGEVNNE